jgi:hypothetical protein
MLGRKVIPFLFQSRLNFRNYIEITLSSEFECSFNRAHGGTSFLLIHHQPPSQLSLVTTEYACFHLCQTSGYSAQIARLTLSKPTLADCTSQVITLHTAELCQGPLCQISGGCNCLLRSADAVRFFKPRVGA